VGRPSQDHDENGNEVSAKNDEASMSMLTRIEKCEDNLSRVEDKVYNLEKTLVSFAKLLQE
jgi:hypothetical protein